ncbi:hypothetical protein [Brevibacillus formosus]|uniref:hypothetical protein n=1 Tax=Brevibacillus formosus TaxID=54913 RepID=UPI003F1D079E
MDQIFTDILLKGLGTVVTAVIASFVTFRLTAKQFFSQKWWERKATAYSEIIESLSNLEHYLVTKENILIGVTRLSDQRQDELADEQWNALLVLRKAKGIGEFIICKKASDILEKHMRDYENLYRENPHDDVDERIQIVRNCISELKPVIRKDLKLKS